MEKLGYTDTETLLWDYSETELYYILAVPPARARKTLYQVTAQYAFQWYGLNRGNNFRIIHYPFSRINFTGLTNPCDCPPEENAFTASVSINPFSVFEDDGVPLVFTISLDRISGFDATVNFTFTGTAIEGVDYATVVSHTATIAAGALSTQVSLNPLINPSLEGIESVNLMLTSGISGPGLINVSGAIAAGQIKEKTPSLAAWYRSLSTATPTVVRDRRQPPWADAASYTNDWLQPMPAVIPPPFGWHRLLSIVLPSIKHARTVGTSYVNNWLSPPFIVPTVVRFSWARPLSAVLPSVRHARTADSSYANDWLRSPPVVVTIVKFGWHQSLSFVTPLVGGAKRALTSSYNNSWLSPAPASINVARGTPLDMGGAALRIRRVYYSSYSNNNWLSDARIPVRGTPINAGGAAPRARNVYYQSNFGVIVIPAEETVFSPSVFSATVFDTT